MLNELVPEQVTIVPYDPAWPVVFEQERRVLQTLFAGTGARIEHVGSTAVTGLGAKPIIDIMVGVGTLADVSARFVALEQAGYTYLPEFEAYEPDRRFFRKPKAGTRQFHLHCVRKDSPFFADHILFRDCLREMPELAEHYLKLKLFLARRMANDRQAYTDAKSGFINRALARVRRQQGAAGLRSAME